MENSLITEFGYLNFVKEFKRLAQEEKPYWVKEKEIAAQHGDRSENAEYISAKEQLRNIDKRLRFLEKIINNTTVIETTKIPHDKVNLGSKVTLINLENDEEKEYIIVGTYETNPSKNMISNISPLGRALLGKKEGEEFEFSINNEVFEYEVFKIEMYNFES